MHYVVLDIEMHPIEKKYTEERKICVMETIELGAVALDDKYNPVDEKKIYVHPDFCSELQNRYVDMTGITESMLSTAPHFSEAIADFFGWCLGFDDDVEILAWSNSDRHQIVSEMKLKQYVPDEREKKLIDGWKDFQKEFTKLIGGGDVPRLDKAMDYAGLPFEGKQHDALNDARNTAQLVILARTDANTLRESAYARQKRDSGGCTLADIFDFSALFGDSSK